MIQFTWCMSQALGRRKAETLRGIEFQKVDRLGDIRIRLAPGFSTFQNLPDSQSLPMSPHQGCRGLQNLHPFRSRSIAPRRPRVACPTDGMLDVAPRGRLDDPDDLSQ